MNQGEMLSEEIASHEWADRFEPMRAKRIAPKIPSEVVVPVENLATIIKETSSEIKHRFILEGFATNRRELVLLGFIPQNHAQNVRQGRGKNCDASLPERADAGFNA